MSPQKHNLTLRRASESDSESLLSWRNDPTTRVFSLSSAVVTRDEHNLWLNGALNDKNCLMLIGEANGKPVGMVRINILYNSTLGQVSINLNPSDRGKGMSRQMLGESLAYGHKIFDQISEYAAEIHVGNEASKKIFKSLGFVNVSESPVNNFETYLLNSELIEISQ